ncbi:MAG: 23S rRNA (uracil(1939)-C(5))-methyltransferase RlmD, partial [Phascolarctobacterium sp.]|nr:23S rRNA (uracil(1939)-C(5))-methyltransferase RlmD [Phascolarctobacterium sp.]
SVVDTEGCLIQKEANNQVLVAVRKWMQKFNVTAYDEKTGKGLVRHVMSRVGVHSGEVMAVLITSAYDIPYKKELIDILVQDVPGLVSVIQNINKKPTNIIMGNKTRVIYGNPNIKDSLGALSFNVSAQSFFQVNSEQAEKLYNKALEYAALTGKETVVDVYCGTGTISLYMAKHAQKVYGIEIVAPAIEDAKKNAVANGCSNAEFILGDAAVELPALLESGVSPDVIMLDPPRAGCEERVLAAICKVKPERIVYVSCNPASLARDMAYLEQNGYKGAIAQPVDMFAFTSHVETVALLVKE